MIATAASRTIEMMSIEPEGQRMTLTHSTELATCAQYRSPWPCNVDQIAQTCSLGSAKDRLYPFVIPFVIVSGEAKNVQMDVGVRVGHVGMRAGACGGGGGILSPAVLSVPLPVPVLSAARAARDRGRAAP